MADPTAADDTPLEDDPWDPLKAEYEDLRAQELQKSRATYQRRLERERLHRDINAHLAAHDDG